jgi:hypothetical protein
VLEPLYHPSLHCVYSSQLRNALIHHHQSIYSLQFLPSSEDRRIAPMVRKDSRKYMCVAPFHGKLWLLWHKIITKARIMVKLAQISS